MEKNSCPICKNELYGDGELGRHIKEVHTCVQCTNLKIFCKCIFKCTFENCSSQFGKPEELQRHIEYDHLCALCNQELTTCMCQDAEFEGLFGTWITQDPPCSLCNSVTCTCEDIPINQLDSQSGHPCTYATCTSVFINQEELNNHLLCDHMCPMCNQDDVNCVCDDECFKSLNTQDLLGCVTCKSRPCKCQNETEKNTKCDLCHENNCSCSDLDDIFQNGICPVCLVAPCSCLIHENTSSQQNQEICPLCLQFQCVCWDGTIILPTLEDQVSGPNCESCGVNSCHCPMRGVTSQSDHQNIISDTQESESMDWEEIEFFPPTPGTNIPIPRCPICNELPCVCEDMFILSEPVAESTPLCFYCRQDPCSCQVTTGESTKRRCEVQLGGQLAKRQRLDTAPITTLCDIISVELLRSKYCPACDISFPYVRDLQHHLFVTHPEYYDGAEIAQVGMGQADTMNLILTRTAFEAYHLYECDMSVVIAKDIQGVFHSLMSRILTLVNQYLVEWCTFKVQFSIVIQVSKQQSDGNGKMKTLTEFRPLNGFMYPIMRVENINVAIQVTIEHLKERIAEFIRYGSGWNLDKIFSFEMMVVRYDPFSGGSRDDLPQVLKNKYRSLISVPADDNLCFARAIYAHPDVHKMKLGTAHGNRDLQQKCFYDDKIYNGFINWSGIEFPFSMKQVNKFEQQNQHIALTIVGFSQEFCEKKKQRTVKRKTEDHESVDMCIDSVASYDGESADDEEEDDPDQYIFIVDVENEKDYRKQQKLIRQHCVPLHVPKVCDNKINIDLLLLLDNEGPEHYVFVKNLHGLLATQTKGTKHICRHCLHCFNTDYDTHVKFCAALGKQKTVFPAKSHLKFEHFCRTQKAPFTIIADFEAFPVPTGNVFLQDPENMDSETVKLAVHEPCGYSWKVVDWEENLIDQNVYRLGDVTDSEGKQVNDVAKRFLTEMVALNEEYQNIMKEYEREAKKTMRISENDQATFRTPNQLVTMDCFFCHKKFTWDDVHLTKIVRHHSHLAPYDFQGFAHKSCNVMASIPKKISVIFHNLKGYDGHFLVQAATSDIVKNIEVIPQTGEKFMSIIVNNQIKFIDSALFMPESLDSLVKNMDKKFDFNILRQAFKEYDEGKVNLLLEKGAYPYSYMTSIEKFNETCLPPKEYFRNDLTRKRIDNDVYKHAQKVWKAFNIKNLGEWHDLYVKCDTALLACVWYKLRNCLYDNYGLDVNHYFSLPMFSLDASLKMTGAELEYIKDPTMHVWLESAIRGGLVSAGDLRVAKANNKFLPDYNKKRPTSYIVYWDANNLYGTALSQFLPYGDFKWADAAELRRIRKDPISFVLGNPRKRIQPLGDEDTTGWFFEVDLEVPNSLHDDLNAYPPAPCSRVVDESETSCMQKQLGFMVGANMKSNEKRLIADLKPKLNYVCHYRALRRWLQLGVVITKVHRAVKFVQLPWMKPFVDFNTDKRQKATSEIDKKFYKLMNNTGYGKLIEQKRERRRIQVVLSQEKALRLNKKPTVDHVTILDNNTVLLTMKRMQVTLDRPIAAGVAVLDISKVIMFNFHYDFIVPTYKGRFNLLYTDTDSMIYLIETDNVYDDCLKYQDRFFDMSEYDPNDPILGKYYNPKNKKKLGYFTDETPHGIISEVVVNKPKMYCVRTMPTVNIVENNGEYNLKKRAKGIGRSTVENDITFENYVKAIDPETLQEAQTFADSKTIRSFKHLIFTIDSRKKAINGYDIKRYSPDGIVTFAYGHKDIPLYENDVECSANINLDTCEYDVQKFASDFVESFYK